MSRLWRNGVPAAGLVGSPLATLAGQAGAYALTPKACGASAAVLLPVTMAAVAVALGAAVLSWRGLSPDAGSGGGGAPRRFLALAGMLVSLLFAGVIVLQGIAPAIVGPCLR